MPTIVARVAIPEARKAHSALYSSASILVSERLKTPDLMMNAALIA
jgi:hypothetical protein